MAKTTSRLSLQVLLTALLLGLSTAQEEAPADGLYFDWIWPGGTVRLDYALPAGGLPHGEPVGAALPRAPGLTAHPQVATGSLQLELSAEPGVGDQAFDSVELRWEGGDRDLVALTPTFIVSVDRPGSGPLQHLESVIERAPGIELAVVVVNDGNEPVTITSVRYLPEGVEYGRLLAAMGSSSTALARLHDEPPYPPSRAMRQETGVPVAPAGYTWISPEDPQLQLAAGEAVVLVWWSGTFATRLREKASRYALRPVIDYVVPGVEESFSLGLPVGPSSVDGSGE